MPLYEYECGDCGRRFERIQKFSDPLVTACPHCGGVVRKLLSSPAIQFKGSGFYITDYAKGGSGADDKGEKAEKGEKKAAEATTSSSSETTAAGSASESTSKPAPATESKSSESPKKTETTKS